MRGWTLRICPISNQNRNMSPTVRNEEPRKWVNIHYINDNITQITGGKKKDKDELGEQSIRNRRGQNWRKFS